jgi:hypothetical protein
MLCNTNIKMLVWLECAIKYKQNEVKYANNIWIKSYDIVYVTQEHKYVIKDTSLYKYIHKWECLETCCLKSTVYLGPQAGMSTRNTPSCSIFNYCNARENASKRTDLIQK